MKKVLLILITLISVCAQGQTLKTLKENLD